VRSVQLRALKDKRAKALLECEAEEHGESAAFSGLLCESEAVLRDTLNPKAPKKRDSWALATPGHP